jgi:hypothetical protein
MNGNERDAANGQYTFTGGMDRLCRCGHRLGVHAAARVSGKQPCFCGDDGLEDCDCQKFRPVRK